MIKSSKGLKASIGIAVLLSGILVQKIELVSPASGFVDGKNNTIQIKSHSTGNVSNVFVTSGERVSKGDPLISFDNHDAIFKSLSLSKNGENLRSQVSRLSHDICVSRVLLQALTVEDSSQVSGVLDSCFESEDLKAQFSGIVQNYQWKVRDYFEYKNSVEKLVLAKREELKMIEDTISLGRSKVSRLRKHNAPELQINDAQRELNNLLQGKNKSESEITKLRLDTSTRKSTLFNEISDRLTRARDELYEIKDEVALNDNELELAQLKLKRSTIHAPMSGVILSLEENVGKDYYLEESEAIMILQKERAEMVVSAKFETKFRQNLNVGMQVKIRPSLAGVKGTYTGTIARISEDSFEDDRKNDETRYYKVMIEPDGELDLSEGTEVRVFAVGAEVTVFDFIKSVLIKNKTIFEPY